MESTKFKRVQCVDRALDIIEGAAGGECRSVAELAAAAHLLPATAYNIVKTLMARGAVTLSCGRYRIGPELGLLAEKWDIGEGLPTLLRPVLADIARRLGNEHVSVTVLNGETAESSLFFADRPGHARCEYLRRVWDDPMELAAGRVLAAFGDEGLWMGFIERHIAGGAIDSGERDFDHYRYYKQLGSVRAAGGFAGVFHGESGAYGAAAVPAFSRSGVLLGAVGCSCPGEEAGPEHLAKMLDELKQALNAWREERENKA